MLRQVLLEWQIGLLINFLENGVKIPNRLMRVDDEDEVDFVQGWALRTREVEKWIEVNYTLVKPSSFVIMQRDVRKIQIGSSVG
jgi:hypothetical protein